MSARPTGASVLAAEWLRGRRTFTWGAVLVALVFAVQTVLFARAALAAGAVVQLRWHGNALGWMHLYAAGFAVPLGILSGVMAQWREERWRQGGTAWRAVNPRAVLMARLLVLGISALACQVALIAPVVLDAVLSGSGVGPWPSYVGFGLFMWLVVTGASAWGMALYRWLRVAAVGVGPVAGLVWSVMGVMQAERDHWWLLPWTWTARAPLTLLGVHGSSVLLEPESPVWHYPLLPSFVLAAAWGGLGALLAVMPSTPAIRAPRVDEGQQPAPSRAKAEGVPRRRAGSRSCVLAVAGVLPWGLWGGLALPLWGLLAIVRVSYPADYAQGLFELAAAPAAAAVVGVTAWGRLQPGWRALLLRRSTSALLGAVTLLSGMFLVPVLVAAWAIVAWGGPLARPGHGGPGYSLAVLPAVALLVFAASLSVALVTRVAVAIAGNAVLLLGGLVIGGNNVLLAAGLWPAAPWGWLRTAHALPGSWPTLFALAIVVAMGFLLIAVLRGKAAALRE